MAKKNYSVIVGNIGGVVITTNKKVATDCYDTYVLLSKDSITRAHGESVTLFCNHEVIKEHIGHLQLEDEI